MGDAPVPARPPARSEDLVALLHEGGHVKVWSLIVTIFGDAILPRGGMVSALTLQAMTGALGVSDGARRTALSRLASDGWIETARVGRNAFYRLAEAGRETFEEASARIYAAPVARVAGDRAGDRAGDWLVAVLPAGADVEALAAGHDALPLDARTLLLDAEPDARPDAGQALAAAGAFLLRGGAGAVPEWLREAALRVQFPGTRAPLEAFRRLDETIAREPREAMIARSVLIHLWRRQCLRERDLPTGLADDADRALVARTYRALLPASEAWLDENATGPKGPVVADKAVLERFQAR